MSGRNHKEKPVQRTNGKTPLGCSKCKTGFREATWPRSKWTMTGWSPWCPQCHADLAHDSGVFAIRPGPKPKAKVRGVAKGNPGWTNLPI